MADALVSIARGRPLTATTVQGLADVPPEMEWFANFGNSANRRAYEAALKDFIRFTGIERPEEFRTVTRAHVIAWRDALAGRALSATTIRHRLSALASLFDYLCDKNAVTTAVPATTGNRKSTANALSILNRRGARKFPTQNPI